MKFGALDDFTEACETAALWSSADDAGNPLDCGEYELAPETRAAIGDAGMAALREAFQDY